MSQTRSNPPPSSSSWDSPPFFFGIPLRAKATALDWTCVCHNFAKTLDSLSRQTCQSFRVLVSCHDIPNVDTRGLDIRFIKAGFPVPIDDNGRTRSDKHKKKHRLGIELANEMENDAYFMPLDADDLVHPRLVETVLGDDNRRGYLLEKGYIYNAATGQCRACDPQTHPFWRYCGSCAVIHFTPDDLPQYKGDSSRYYSRFLNHKDYADVARDAGRALMPFDEPMAVYVIDHGENDWTVYRQQKDGKSNYVARAPIRDKARLNALRETFPQLDLNEVFPPAPRGGVRRRLKTLLGLTYSR
ncbi:hypothetical protein [Salinicola halophilus]|uniref:hypothetical protein n=1 Tax=Salinicola halophilus TaxID=184065 RepID=UPI0013A67DD6|nr:hypothetical protein [Salinicola halophilus]